MPKLDESYCGAPATTIVFRGRTARLFTCDACAYEGGGRKMPYARDSVPEKERKSGTYYGPERLCGERVA